MEQANVKQSTVTRVVIASFIGTTIEWYDFFLYTTAAALFFNRLFFPTFDPLAGTMAAYATHAVGFVARPVGAIIFGHFGDRIGRKSMLVTTLMLMGVATFLIGLLPTYEQIGVAAPLLLVTLRFVQGLGVGGEWGGAVLMAVEHGHHGRRGWYASWVQAGVSAGLLLASGIVNLIAQLPPAAQLSWGWRVPFLLGVLLLGIGMFIRLKVFESPLFSELRRSDARVAIPILDVFRRYPGSVLLATGARFAENGCYYIFTMFVLTYGKSIGIAEQRILPGVMLASAVHFIVIPTFGRISDRLGRRPVYMAGAIGLALFAFPFFLLVNAGWVWLAIVLGLIVHGAMYAPQAAFFSELFGTEVRYSGASIGYHLSSLLAGGLAPLIATYLLKTSGGEPWLIAGYLIGMALITIVSIWLASETHQKDIQQNF